MSILKQNNTIGTVLNVQSSADNSNKADIQYILSIVSTLFGFLIAVVINRFFPQYADLKLEDYSTTLIKNITIVEAYEIVLTGIIIFYSAIAALSFKNEVKKRKFIKQAPFRMALGIALALWDILGTKVQVFAQPFFPGPSRIIEAFLIESDYIFENTLYSLRLYAVGFILGVILGVGTGILIGWFPKLNYWIFPVLKITGVIPAVAWMPFALTLFPTPFAAAVFLIIICAWFPVAFLTSQGITGTPKIHYEVAKTLGAKTPYLVFHVAIPHAMPQIFTGISTANGFAFTTLVMSEMMGQPGGLGYYINASKVWSAYYKVFAAIIVMAILFSIIMTIINEISVRILKWQRGMVK